MQASKKIPFDDPNVLNGIRALYVLSNLIIAGIYVYIMQQINKKKGVSCPPARPYNPAGTGAAETYRLLSTNNSQI